MGLPTPISSSFFSSCYKKVTCFIPREIMGLDYKLGCVVITHSSQRMASYSCVIECLWCLENEFLLALKALAQTI